MANPVKTQGLERVFNRALTSVLFSGREEVHVIDIFISIMAENNNHSSYFMMKYNIKRDEFLEWSKNNDRNNVMYKQQEQYLNGIINEYCENLNPTC